MYSFEGLATWPLNQLRYRYRNQAWWYIKLKYIFFSRKKCLFGFKTLAKTTSQRKK